jgi:hypothetical protein
LPLLSSLFRIKSSCDELREKGVTAEDLGNYFLGGK